MSNYKPLIVTDRTPYNLTFCLKIWDIVER